MCVLLNTYGPYLMMSSSHTFAELRSLMNMPALDEARRQHLFDLLLLGNETHRELYRSTWLPYIQSFPHHFEQPLTSVHSVKELEHTADLIPCARFELHVPDKAQEFSTLERSPALHTLSSLVLKTPSDALIQSLLDSTKLNHITALTLCRTNNLNTRHFQRLMQSPLLKNLTKLNLDLASISKHIQTLAQSRHMSSITHLSLASNAIEDHEVYHLAQSPYLKNLTYLSLATNQRCWHRWPSSGTRRRRACACSIPLS